MLHLPTLIFGRHLFSLEIGNEKFDKLYRNKSSNTKSKYIVQLLYFYLLANVLFQSAHYLLVIVESPKGWERAR